MLEAISMRILERASGGRKREIKRIMNEEVTFDENKTRVRGSSSGRNNIDADGMPWT